MNLGFEPEEAEQFYEALDQLPDAFDTEDTEEKYEIEEEDWQWLTKAVGREETADVVKFASVEKEELMHDPDLVRAVAVKHVAARPCARSAHLSLLSTRPHPTP